MKKLISSIEYGQILKEKVEKGELSKIDYFKLRTDFDEKITQQPHLSNFIPCVEENGVWKPIEKPFNYEIWEKLHYNNGKKEKGTIGFEYHLKYQTALSKVLFSGWELIASDEEAQEFQIEKINENLWITFSENEIVVEDLTNTDYIETINDLTTLNLPLTETGAEHFKLKF